MQEWQRTANGLLAALFAFLLPLICWGVLETPGHPHGAVHILFGQPPDQHVSLVAAARFEQKAAVRQAVLDSCCADPIVVLLADAPPAGSVGAQMRPAR